MSAIVNGCERQRVNHERIQQSANIGKGDFDKALHESETTILTLPRRVWAYGFGSPASGKQPTIATTHVTATVFTHTTRQQARRTHALVHQCKYYRICHTESSFHRRLVPPPPKELAMARALAMASAIESLPGVGAGVGTLPPPS